MKTKLLAALAALLLPAAAAAAPITFTGFEDTATGECIAGGFNEKQTSVVHTGTYALRVYGTASGYLGYCDLASTGELVDDNSATAYAHFRFRVKTAPASGSEQFYVTLDSSGVRKLQLRLTSGRQIAVYDAGNSLVATGATALALDTWYWLQVRTGTGVAGAYEVRINGVTELTGTANQWPNNHAKYVLGRITPQAVQTFEMFFDDFVVDDASLPEQSWVKVALPDGDGDLVDWIYGPVPSNYTQVDEFPTADDDTSYLDEIPSGSAASHLVTLQSAATAGIPGPIRAVMVVASLKKWTGSGASASYLFTRCSSGDVLSSPRNVGSSYSHGRTILTTCNGTAWSSAFDSVQIGVRDSSLTGVRATQIYGMVHYGATPTPTNTPTSTPTGTPTATPTNTPIHTPTPTPTPLAPVGQRRMPLLGAGG